MEQNLSKEEILEQIKKTEEQIESFYDDIDCKRSEIEDLECEIDSVQASINLSKDKITLLNKQLEKAIYDEENGLTTYFCKDPSQSQLIF